MKIVFFMYTIFIVLFLQLWHNTGLAQDFSIQEKERLLALGCEPKIKKTDELVKECNSFGCFKVQKWEWDYSECIGIKKSRGPASLKKSIPLQILNKPKKITHPIPQ